MGLPMIPSPMNPILLISDATFLHLRFEFAAKCGSPALATVFLTLPAPSVDDISTYQHYNRAAQLLSTMQHGRRLTLARY
jgi:hypothetical protein